MNVQTVALVVFTVGCFTFSVISADLNTVKTEALKEIEKRVLCVMKEGNDTNLMLQWKPKRVDSSYQHMKNFGQLMLNNSMNELGAETKTNYIKADIQNSPVSIYNCIAVSSNAGQVQLGKDYDNFFRTIFYDRMSTLESQENVIKNWTKEINAMEEKYRKDYNAATFNIVNAKDETVIKNTLNTFKNLTAVFEKQIKSINASLDALHLNFVNRLQAQTKTLSTTLAASNKAAFERMSKCFGPKSIVAQIIFESQLHMFS